jgi:hypothetical protein
MGVRKVINFGGKVIRVIFHFWDCWISEFQDVNQGWIYCVCGVGGGGGAPSLALARGGAIFHDKAKNIRDKMKYSNYQSFACRLICSALSVALGADYMEHFQPRGWTQPCQLGWNFLQLHGRFQPWGWNAIHSQHWFLEVKKAAP